jgi:hypothetical protein
MGSITPSSITPASFQFSAKGWPILVIFALHTLIPVIPRSGKKRKSSGISLWRGVIGLAQNQKGDDIWLGV